MQPSLFESFNARSLDPEQVGRGYIFSPAFREVAERSNTAVIGPRGSGKTTLLKMLTLPALLNWRDQRSNEIITGMDYISIYVPADFTWNPDFRRPVSAKPSIQVDDLLSYALFRSHVLLAICETMEFMRDQRVCSHPILRRFALPPNESKIEIVAKGLADSWDLHLSFGGAHGLKDAVTKRIKSIQYLLTVSSLRPVEAASLVEQHPFLASNFTDDLRVFADQIDAAYDRKFSWAVCFDEVEITPPRIKEQIWRSSRSFDQRFLVKFSASPFDDEIESIFGSKMPMRDQDYHPVFLLEHSAHEVKRFSQQVLSAICREVSMEPAAALDLLGSNLFFDNPKPQSLTEGHGGPYERDGVHYKRFLSLQAKDPSFREYLDARGIDLDASARMPERVKAAEIRKLISTVAVRNEFFFERREDWRKSRAERKRRYRAKKGVSELYTGADALFALCEGNPRWLIGMLRPLLQKDGRTTRNKIDRPSQSKRIEVVIASFLALLSTVQTDAGKPTVVDLIETIGDFFSEETLGDKFRPEPYLSFVIDKQAPAWAQEAIGRAVNQGAFVLLKQKDKPARPGEIAGRRLRLSHLLAPLFRLPLVVGRGIDLSKMLEGEREEDRVENELLFDLFGAVGR